MKVVVTITSMLFQRMFILLFIRRFVSFQQKQRRSSTNTIPCSALFEYLYSTTVVFNVFGFLLTTHTYHTTLHHLNNTQSATLSYRMHTRTHAHTLNNSLDTLVCERGFSLHMTMPKSQNAKLPGNVNELALYLLLLLLPLLELLLLLLRFSVLSVRCYFSRVS